VLFAFFCSQFRGSGFSFQHVSLSAFGFVWSVVLQSRGSISAFQLFSFSAFVLLVSGFRLPVLFCRFQVSGFSFQLSGLV
jgi:hypothetical protein